jgi:hypothetical protein
MAFPESYLANLTPQETTKQAPHEVGANGAELSYHGSSVVAGEKADFEE